MYCCKFSVREPPARYSLIFATTWSSGWVTFDRLLWILEVCPLTNPIENEEGEHGHSVPVFPFLNFEVRADNKNLGTCSRAILVVCLY